MKMIGGVGRPENVTPVAKPAKPAKVVEKRKPGRQKAAA